MLNTDGPGSPPPHRLSTQFERPAEAAPNKPFRLASVLVRRLLPALNLLTPKVTAVPVPVAIAFPDIVTVVPTMPVT